MNNFVKETDVSVRKTQDIDLNIITSYPYRVVWRALTKTVPQMLRYRCCLLFFFLLYDGVAVLCVRFCVRQSIWQYDARNGRRSRQKKKWIKCNMKYSSEHCDKVIHPCHAENMLDLTWNGFKNDVPNRMKRKLADISTTILLFFIFKYACFNRVRIAFSAAMKSNCERFYDCVAIKMGTIYAPQKGKEWERERESEAHLPLFGMGDWVDGFGWLEWSINTREWWAQAMNMCC